MVSSYSRGTGLYSGLNCIWAYALGPLTGGLLAGLWKQYDGTVKIHLHSEELHPKHQKKAANAIPDKNMVALKPKTEMINLKSPQAASDVHPTKFDLVDDKDETIDKTLDKK